MAISIPDLIQMSKEHKKICALTAYDFVMASLLDHAGVEVILVGDSLGCVFQGNENTISVTLDEIIYHSKIVSKAVKNAVVVCDMPFLSYQVSTEQAVLNAGRILKETNCKAVKLEGGVEFVEHVKAITKASIPVMGHIGLTPQSVYKFGGNKVQGKNEFQANKIIEDALALENAGVFSIVLECVPSELAKKITESVKVPTIGIGAGVHCSGQILVLNDLLGLSPESSERVPKFVRKYADLSSETIKAVQAYRSNVKEGIFPSIEESY